MAERTASSVTTLTTANEEANSPEVRRRSVFLSEKLHRRVGWWVPRPGVGWSHSGPAWVVLLRFLSSCAFSPQFCI
jgi:hypothetical protein